MSDDPWNGYNILPSTRGEGKHVIEATATCPPGMPKFAGVYSLSFEELGIDPDKVRKATERMTFLSVDSMKKADEKP